MPTDTVDVVEDHETWRNGTNGIVHVKNLDHRGDLNADVVLRAGQILHIKPSARRLNQDKVVAERFDPFLNGALIPVHLVEDDPDTPKLLANPNIIDDSTIRELLQGDAAVLMERLNKITHPGTLERVLVIATDENVSIRRYQAIQQRIAEVANQALAASADEPDDDDAFERSRRDRRDRVRDRDSGPIGFNPAAAQRL